MNPTKLYFYPPPLLLLHLVIFQFCIALEINNKLSSNDIVRDGDIFVSRNKTFALGFFSPGDSPRRYVGIWYNKIPDQTVVWVANRDNPLNDTSGALSINTRGNLIIYTKTPDVPLWSTNISSLSSTKPGTMAKLLDSGNLVITQQESQEIIWQSFDYPTNTLLPYMKLGLDRRTGFNRILTSWKAVNDPATGNFSYRIDPTGFPQLFLDKGRSPWWRGGPWTGHRWSGVPAMTPNFIFNVSYVNNISELSIVYGVTNNSIVTRMALDESGFIRRATWNDKDRKWFEFWSAPVEWCDKYGQCGPNSNCDLDRTDVFVCTCLPGFEPKSAQDWYLRDGSSGCVRKQNESTCRSGEGFVKVSRVKVPDTSVARVNMSLSLEACQKECLMNCSCVAYTSADDSAGGTGCVMWHGDLVDTRTYAAAAGQDLYVRVDAAELIVQNSKPSSGKSAKKRKVIILVTTTVTSMLLVAFSVYCLVTKNKKVNNMTERGSNSPCGLSMTTSNASTFLMGDSSGVNKLEKGRTNSALPLFDLSTILIATDNFSFANKLGEGGFGTVYKGVLYDGKEIAVKRLSKHSGQGIQELKNEITLIAKLQHRNLVKILGSCIQDEEKLLVYEYLPNKSLDSFIFDERKKELLDWKKRSEIIVGVARGMLYLHQDSRLRIIHRDLKASNVLLGADLNPKIADFGMARIFGGDQIEANTTRVVGTYGYMSPEYAMEGLFSIKSDVYSFGVLLLEIITSRKNNNYYHDESSLNLVGHVWKLWKEGRGMEIVDTALDESEYGEIVRYIHIGLLCVQEQAVDRPNMSAVVFMLSNDVPLPTPKQPAFIIKRNYTSNHGTDPSTSEGANSVNDVTFTILEAR